MRRILLLLLLSASAFAQTATLDALRRSFEKPPDDSRIMMRWWWFGSAVQNRELEREMRLMKQGGIGGFEVQPVYPLSIDHNLPYLSKEFLDALHFTSEKAHELGLRLDLTLGSGWPYGGPHIPATLAAGRLRWERARAQGTRVPVPSMSDGEKLVAVFAGDREVATPQIKDGILTLPSASEVSFFISSRTGQQVKRPAVGAEGFVLDHYDRAALDLHLKTVADRLMQALKPYPPYAVFCDSLEVYGSDWTGDFLDEFRKRRGYDLRPHLLELADGRDLDAEKYRHDWGRTLTELLNDRFVTPLHEWAQRNGTKLRIQAYGTPPATLSTSSLADLPEGEGIQWKTLSSTRWASSSAHLYGRPVVSSETWTWLHSPVFRASPLDMKAEADLHFLQGVNQFIGHGWPYTPEGIEYPGWRFYAAGVFNEKNPWWIAMPDIALYFQRISYLLRQGSPANTVAVYLPNDDAWSHFALGRADLRAALLERLGPDLVSRILDAGYSLDFFDDAALERVLGGPYKMVVLPAGTSRAPAVGGLPLVHDGADLVSSMAAVTPPDVSLTPPAPDFGYVRRKIDGGDIYFIANTGNHPLNAKATFRTDGTTSEWWDALSGRITPTGGGSALDLHLDAYESRVLVFSKAAPQAIKTAAAPASIDLTSGWKITYPDDAPADRQYFSGLATYEKSFQATSPRGTLTFGEGKPIAKSPGMGYQALLDAPVREAAVVFVNGKRAGAVWCPPYSLDVTEFLRAGENTLRIEVANLAVNYMAARRPPDYRLLNLRYGSRFDAQDMDKIKPEPAGLLGAIRLVSR